MTIEAPKIDKRNQQDIVKQVRQLAIQYCPEMKSIEKDKQADALIQIFSRMMEIIIQRLNKIPDKNFLTFMDLVGVRLTEPRVARAPLTFTMAKKASQYGSIPAGTQVASEIKGEEVVIFETEKELTVISPKLIKAVSFSPVDDKWADHSPVLFDKEKEANQELFKGKKLIPHRIYLGHRKLFNFKEAATIVLDVNPGITINNSVELKWYYYKADSPDPIPLHAEYNNGSIILNNVSGISEKTLVGLDKETDKQKSWTSNWIFAELNTPIPGNNLPEIISIKARVKIAPASSAGSGTISSNGNAVNGDKTVFTKELKIGDSITAAGQTRIVNIINSDISLTVDSAIDPLLPPGTKFTYAPAGTGTISSNGMTVKGEKTVFTKDFKIGDSITAAGQTRIIKEIHPETLTIDSAFNPLLPPGTKFTYAPAGTGTISSNGMTVKGEKTVFTKELKIGDSITAARQTRIVKVIKSDTELTLDSAFNPLLASGTIFTYAPSGTGKISCDGKIVLGNQTIFTKELKIGDSITAAGQTRIVKEIRSDTQLITDSAFNPSLPGIIFTYAPPGTGTISSDGMTVKGEKTVFTKELKIGDSITAAGQTRIIKEIYEPLIVDSAFDPLLPPRTYYSYKSPPPVDKAFSNNIPLDLTKDFNPFGEKPKYNDTFYIGSKEIFSKEKADVFINIILSSGIEPNTGDIMLSWEFWDGKSWKEVGKSWKNTNTIPSNGVSSLEGAEFNDLTAALTKNGLVTFKCPKIEVLEINGKENYWIRVRIVGGNYGNEAKHEPSVIYDGEGKINSTGKKVTGVGTHFIYQVNRGDSIIASNQTRFIDNINSDIDIDIDKPFNSVLTGVEFSFSKSWVYKPATYKPPSISTLTLSYRFEPPSENLEVVLTYNDFVYQDKTNKSSFKPFLHPAVDSTSLYLAFDKNIATLPVTIFFPLLEKSAGLKMTPVSLTGTGTISSEIMQVSGDKTLFSRELKKGDYIATAGQTRTVTTIVSDIALTIDSAFDPPLHAGTIFSYFIFPSFVWEYWTGKKWQELKIDKDNTKNLTKKELIQFLAPADLAKRQCFKFEKEFEMEKEYYWIRAKLEKGTFVDFPRLKTIYTNTVWAKNIVTVKEEVLGSSNGNPGQVFKFTHSPVLPGQKVLVMEVSLSEGERQNIINEEGKDSIKEIPDEAGNIIGLWVRWHEKDNFYFSYPNSRHYVIDRNRGEITFGDGDRGMIPLAGKDNIKCNYESGGGSRGNKAKAGTITKLRTAFPYIDSVTNHETADGGGEEEKLPHVRERGPQTIKHRDRAVTYEDYEWLVREASPKVTKVKCLPAKDPSQRFKPGWVTLIIVPESEYPKPYPTQQLISVIEEYLFKRTSTYLITDISQVNLIGPGYVRVWIEASVKYTSIPEAKTIEGRIIEKLNRFFNPLIGGPENTGWEFGRNVYISEVYEVIEKIDGVDYVENLFLNASVQVYTLILDEKINITGSYPENSRIETSDGKISLSLAEKLQEEASDTFHIVGFKEGDSIILSYKDKSTNLVIRSVSHEILGDILECESSQIDIAYPVGSIVKTTDGMIKSFILNEVPAGDIGLNPLKISILKEGESFRLNHKDNSLKQLTGKIKKVIDRVEKIFIDTNYLVYSGEHSVNTNVRRGLVYPYLMNTNKKEIHDLNNKQSNCNLNEIKKNNMIFIRTLDKIDKYDYCRWCFGQEMSKR